MDKQIYVEGNLIHPETNSGVVTHNNSTLKNFLDGLVSTDNMPAFMQSFLQSQNYIQANQALKTTPETYFDEAFNTWTPVSAPVVSGGVLIKTSGTQYLQSTPGWTIGASDFSIEVRWKPDSILSSSQNIISAFNTSGSGSFIAIGYFTTGTIAYAYRNASGTRYDLNGSNTYAAGNWIHTEINFDSTTNTRRLFVNGSLEASDTQAMNSQKMFRIGASVSAKDGLIGSIDYVRISDCVRHTSSYTPQTPSFDDNTLSLLLFD